MNELVIIALVVLATLLLVRTREGLTATPTIQGSTRNAKEITRRGAMVPEPMKSELASEFSPTAPKDIVVGMRAGELVIDPAFQEWYTPATAPLTESSLDTYIASLRTKLTTVPSTSRYTEKLIRWIDNGNIKTLLKAYFLSEPAIPSAVSPAPSADFNNTLQKYRTALLDAKTTGNPGKKVEADTLKAWLDAKLLETQKRLTASRTTIQSFVNDYAGSTSEIEQVRKKFKEVRDRGPVLQDVYETDKRNVETPILNYDPTPIYSKSLLIVGLAVVAFVVARRI